MLENENRINDKGHSAPERNKCDYEAVGGYSSTG